MRVIVNGEQREIASSSVDALLSELEYEGTHFAIALNFDVLPRSRWAQTPLKNGDEIEIITPRRLDSISGSLEYWIPTGACHRAAHRAGPVAGMTDCGRNDELCIGTLTP